MSGAVNRVIRANQPVFQHYTSGIVADDGSCGTQLDHAVLAVGYGTAADGTVFTIVKNSWAATWGDAGFIKLAASATTSACGHLNQPSLVHVDQN